MYRHGLSLLPGAVPPFIARGHPLMFHFLAASWMHIFGTTLFSGHCFALTISVMMIMMTYLFGRDFFSARVGFIAALLLSTQAVFIAQSAFLLPEMMMALWSLLCFYSYLKKKYILFILCAAAALITKESGLIIICALAIFEITRYLFSKEKDNKAVLKKINLVRPASNNSFCLLYTAKNKVWLVSVPVLHKLYYILVENYH